MAFSKRAIQIVNERDAATMIRFLNELAAKGIDTASLPKICDVDTCGQEGHDWACDIQEEWQNSNLPDDHYDT